MKPQPNGILQDLQDDMDAARDKGQRIGTLNDGYHSFDELYNHRHALFLALAQKMSFMNTVWVSDKLSNGEPVGEGWIIVGIHTQKGKQITYHIPDTFKNKITGFASWRAKAYEFDGHTSDDVLKRLVEML